MYHAELKEQEQSAYENMSETEKEEYEKWLWDNFSSQLNKKFVDEDYKLS